MTLMHRLSLPSVDLNISALIPTMVFIHLLKDRRKEWNLSANEIRCRKQERSKSMISPIGVQADRNLDCSYPKSYYSQDHQSI